MTSGVYPRKPGAKAGRKPKLSAGQVASIRAQRQAGRSTKFLTAYWRSGEKTIRHVLNGTGAYKEMK